MLDVAIVPELSGFAEPVPMFHVAVLRVGMARGAKGLNCQPRFMTQRFPSDDCGDLRVMFTVGQPGGSTSSKPCDPYDVRYSDARREYHR
jgi:hypothetical protein